MTERGFRRKPLFLSSVFVRFHHKESKCARQLSLSFCFAALRSILLRYRLTVWKGYMMEGRGEFIKKAFAGALGGGSVLPNWFYGSLGLDMPSKIRGEFLPGKI